MNRQAPFALAVLVAATLAVAGAVLSGCGDSAPQTGIIAEITSNLAVPGEIDSVQVTITTAGGAMPYQETFPLAGGSNRYEVPLRVGIRPRGDAAADFRIEASGRLGQARIVSRSATVHFVSDRILLLPLPLLAACINSTCIQPGMTCQDNGACTSDVVDPTTLPPYHPGTDAGPPPDARDGGAGGGGGAGGRGGAGGAGGTGGSAGGASGTGGGAGGTGGSAGGTAGGAGARGGAGGTGGGGTSGGGRGGTAGGGTSGGGGRGGGGGSGGTGGTGGGGTGGGGTGGAGGTGGGGTSGGGGGTGGTGGGGGSGGGVVVTTLNNGLIGYWAFDQSSTSYPDYSGNGNTASAQAGTWTAAGEVGGALDLTSATYFAVSTPGSASVNTITSAVSVSAWIVPLPAGAVYTIMSRIINVGNWKLSLNTTGALSFGAGTRVVASPGMPGDGTKWVHVAASYDGTTARLYLNGAQVAMATFGAISLVGGPVGGGPGGYGPDIGGTYDNINAYHVQIYNGQMDEIVLYNRGLTAAEVDALARGALPMRR